MDGLHPRQHGRVAYHGQTRCRFDYASKLAFEAATIITVNIDDGRVTFCVCVSENVFQSFRIGHVLRLCPNVGEHLAGALWRLRCVSVGRLGLLAQVDWARH